MLAEESGDASDWFKYARACFHRGQHAEALDAYNRMIHLPGALVEQVTKALNNRGILCGQTGRSEEAIADFTRVIELSGAPVEQLATAFYNRGSRPWANWPDWGSHC